MTGWKRSLRLPARRNRHQTVLLGIERLEDRLLLNATSGEQAMSALMRDVTQFRNDLATAPITLLNVPQPSSTNTPTAASVAS